MVKMSKSKYYNPDKIMNMKDLDNQTPWFYIVSSNRSAGKTTSFLKKSLELFKNKKKKTILLYRYQYELNSCCTIFTDVMRLYPNLGGEMKALPNAKGLFYELFLDNKSFGYALSLNNPDSLKKYSPIFSDVEYVIFDEFQTENGKYLPKEIEKFQSLMITISRGGGKQSRPLKVFMLSNMVSIMNPYFIEFNIHKRIKSDTKFLKGHGWIAEFSYNESASNAIKESGLARAFENSNYIKYSTEKEYLIATDNFIEQPKGKAKYYFTILYDGKPYGVREYPTVGIFHVSKKVDKDCKYVATFKASDHNQNTMMLNHYSFLFKNLKDSFNRGNLRFDDVETKNAIFDILAIDVYK